MLSARFASRQLHRGRIGTRGWWVRIQGPVCNLLIICIYLPPMYSKAEVVVLMKGLRAVLNDRSLHDCVILLGDFNVKFPRKYQNIIGPYACEQGERRMRKRTKDLLRLFEQHNLCAPSTYFRPRKRQTNHTWRANRGQGSETKGQIDYVVASKRWRSCFYDSKVYWSAQRFKSGTETDHGLLVTKFRWRLRRQQRKAPNVDWAALKPLKVNDGQTTTNPVLERFEAKCKEIWETQSVERTNVREAGSQDDSNLGGQELQHVHEAAGSTLASATCMTTGLGLVQARTSVVTGAVDGPSRGIKHSENPGLGGPKQRADEGAVETFLKPVTSTVTGPSLGQVGTSTVTGTGNDLDWVLSDGEDGEEGTSLRLIRPTASRARLIPLGSPVTVQASSVASGLKQAEAAANHACTDTQLSSSELLTRLNEVCVRAARTTIPSEETARPRRMRPSLQSV